MTMYQPTITNRVTHRIKVTRRLLINVGTVVTCVHCHLAFSVTIATLITTINNSVGIMVVTIEDSMNPDQMPLLVRTLHHCLSVSTACTHTNI